MYWHVLLNVGAVFIVFNVILLVSQIAVAFNLSKNLLLHL